MPFSASYFGWARGVSGLVDFIILQRPHQAGAAVREGIKALLAMVGPHAAVPCGRNLLRARNPTTAVPTVLLGPFSEPLGGGQSLGCPPGHPC
jgi:hypothetical protein